MKIDFDPGVKYDKLSNDLQGIQHTVDDCKSGKQTLSNVTFRQLRRVKFNMQAYFNPSDRYMKQKIGIT